MRPGAAGFGSSIYAGGRQGATPPVRQYSLGESLKVRGMLVLFGFYVFLQWRIFSKAGFPGALALVNLGALVLLFKIGMRVLDGWQPAYLPISGPFGNGGPGKWTSHPIEAVDASKAGLGDDAVLARRIRSRGYPRPK